MRVYRGERAPGGCRVTVNGEPLPPRLYLESYSTDDFEWGGRGSGAQLALALLAFEFGDQVARRWSRSYESVVRELPPEGWTLTGAEIRAAVASMAEGERVRA